jgi:hypothetical protein
MTDFVDGQQKFSVTAQSVLEELHVSGHRVDRDLAARVILKRPDKFLAARTGGSLDQRFLYDGKTLALYNPANKVYATSPAPETIEKMIDFARETVGSAPAADLLYRGSFPDQGPDLATVVQQTVVDGIICEHLLFGRPGVDFQVWITEATSPGRAIRRHRDGGPHPLSIRRPERLEHRPRGGRCPLRLPAARGIAADLVHAARNRRQVRPLMTRTGAKS